VYEYDFGDSWIHDLRLETTLPINPRKIYPMCVARRYSAPPEDCGGPSAFMANRQYYARLVRGRCDKDLEDCVDDFDDEESDSFSDYDPDRFDRRQLSGALGKLATGSYEEALDEIHVAQGARRLIRSERSRQTRVQQFKPNITPQTRVIAVSLFELSAVSYRSIVKGERKRQYCQ
jgi:Plasmid pRiA4b ORF-3-like protein